MSAPARQRAILVVARSWAEQRVLMRAFAASSDQTRPTINLHGEELAIGPAGVDPHGEWGIHVQPPVDGRAQELREALQLAAKLLAGSKGTPARLQDEQPEFEERATHNWAPSKAPESGGQLDEPGRRTVFGHDGGPVPVPEPKYYEPALHAPTSDSQVIPSSGASRSKNQMRKTPAFWAEVYETPELEQGASSRPIVLAQPQAVSTTKRSLRQTNRYSGVMASQSGGMASQSGGMTAQPQAKLGKKKAAKTVFGFEPQAQPSKKETFAATASKTMPIGLRLDDNERLVLNELGKQAFLSAGGIGRLLKVPDPMEWMSRFMDKLAEFGLDLVSPGNDQDGEATYQLIR